MTSSIFQWLPGAAVNRQRTSTAPVSVTVFDW